MKIFNHFYFLLLYIGRHQIEILSKFKDKKVLTDTISCPEVTFTSPTVGWVYTSFVTGEGQAIEQHVAVQSGDPAMVYNSHISYAQRNLWSGILLVAGVNLNAPIHRKFSTGNVFVLWHEWVWQKPCEISMHISLYDSSNVPIFFSICSSPISACKVLTQLKCGWRLRMTEVLCVPLQWPVIITSDIALEEQVHPRVVLSLKFLAPQGRWYIQEILGRSLSKETTVFSKTFSKQNCSSNRGVMVLWPSFYVSMWQIVSSWALQGTPQLALTWNSLDDNQCLFQSVVHRLY